MNLTRDMLLENLKVEIANADNVTLAAIQNTFFSHVMTIKENVNEFDLITLMQAHVGKTEES